MSILRKILGFPFALLWDIASRTRNYLFDEEIFTSQEFDLPVIGVGNLSMGGSGKTPHVEYLIQLLHDEYPVGVLSRGYKRKTNGYIFASTQSPAKQIGDEPLQYKLKFPDVAVAVSESRVLGIPQLLMDAPQTEVIILDDVFQHRQVKPGLQILLTDYHSMYVTDYIFPAGNLRETRSGAKRADIIIVTKCPANLSETEAERIREKIKPKEGQSLYFSTFFYGQPYSLTDNQKLLSDVDQEVLLVTGIAKPDYLEAYLKDTYSVVFSLNFSDHYSFQIDDLEKIQQAYQNLGESKKIIMMTEKDAVKWIPFLKDIKEINIPMYVQPIQVQFLFGQDLELNEEVLTFVQNFYHVDTSSTN